MFLPFSVTGLLVKEGKILAVSRKNNPNDFGLPGGKLDIRKSIEALEG
jgi:ADP-ribose pyrophosphatase YjhB (NUDIX family)